MLQWEGKSKGTPMTLACGEREEVMDAWRLWHQLQILSDSIWNRYESDFIELSLAEEDRRQRIAGDDQLPF